MNTKAILASTLIAAVLAGTTANAGRADGINNYGDNAQAAQSVEIKKVSLVKPAADIEVEVNR